MISVVLLMAGKGSRMHLDKNKILLPLKDKKIYEYSLNIFLKLGCEVVCVISKENEEELRRLLPENIKYVLGGNTRQESVFNGLKECTKDYVFIHDAARPFISIELLKKILINLNKEEAILLYQKVKDTIRIHSEALSTTLPREQLYAAVTPQCAPLSILKEVYQKANKDGIEVTDDISLIEIYRPDIKINYILSNEENFKITTLLDYELAKIMVEKKND